MDNIPVTHKLTTLSGFSPTVFTGSQQQNFQLKEAEYLPAGVHLVGPVS
jgi:hypothetical protein